ncbi:MAG: phage baseplate assembly protein V [Rhodospirillaceae bacterium]|nr:MAG: phage baseplate assembly protein V [Rhodospirillaceae bacterium]
MKAVSRMMQPLRDRIMLMVFRAVVRLVDDDAGIQRIQVSGLRGETRDKAEHFQPYGWTSVAHPDAEAVVICVGGNRDHPIILMVDDRRYRIRGLKNGELAIYTDEDKLDGGHRIHFKRGQAIEVHAGQEFSVNVGGGASVLTMRPDGTTLVTPDFEARQS